MRGRHALMAEVSGAATVAVGIARAAVFTDDGEIGSIGSLVVL